jgi:hypothetical protein
MRTWRLGSAPALDRQAWWLVSGVGIHTLTVSGAENMVNDVITPQEPLVDKGQVRRGGGTSRSIICEGLAPKGARSRRCYGRHSGFEAE